MDASEPNQSQLDAIAEAFSEAIRRGENPSIDAVLAQHEDPTGRLRSLLESIAMIESLKSLSLRRDATDVPVAVELDHLDDYKIVRQIGRGGMGIVFEAVHLPLSRRVAVKVLATRALEQTKDIERFRRESRAAARLRHTNIVPVFGVGHDQGYHYYVMDFIDGTSMRDWIHRRSGVRSLDPVTVDEHFDQTAGSLELHTSETSVCHEEAEPISFKTQSHDYVRWVARLGSTICDAIQYAHDRGVLHRDIKPANLLIDKNQQVWIADFGLAKLAEQRDATRTGDLVGTPQYMPPESFDGSYDVRSEVYGVGLTLFELLTERPAIQGRTSAEVIRQACSGVALSPRRINPAIPRDLETIVLKSLAILPSERYASARELGDDLRRFVSDQPIAARRTGPLGRTVRWTKREPVVASMTLLTFVLLIALAAVSAFGYYRTRESLASATAAEAAARQSLRDRTEALGQAESQRARAEANLQVALTTFDTVIQNINDRGIHADADFLSDITDRTTPNVTPDDARLLESLLSFLDELATNNSEDLLAESALAARRVGDVYASLGKLREAERAYIDALTRYRHLVVSRPDDPQPILAQAEIMNELSGILSLRGQLGRAMQMFGETVTLLEKSPSVLSSQDGAFQYARAHRLYASLSMRSGLDETISLPRTNYFRFQRSPIGTLLRLRTEDELSAANEAIRTLEDLLKQTPDDSKVIAELARAHRSKARVSSRANQRIDSELSIRRSIDLFEQLLRDNPDSEGIRYELAMTLSSSEAFGPNQIRRANRARELSSVLLQRDPDQQRYQALLARSLESVARHQQRTGAIREAESNLKDAIELYDKLLETSPELRVYATLQAATLEALADLRIRQDSSSDAAKYLQMAIELLHPQAETSPGTSLTRIQLQRLRQKLDRINTNSEMTLNQPGS